MWGEQLASAVISGGFGLLGTQVQNIHNQKLAEQQNQYNLDMWRMQNEYNSPLAQRRRMEEAGYNPNLFYGMGTAGNSSQAPQKVAPQPVDYQGLGKELGRIFNIENIKTLHANRLAAEAEAQTKAVEAADAKDRRSAMSSFGSLYDFNPNTGRYEFNNSGVTTERPRNLKERALYDFTGSTSNRRFFFNQALADDYSRRALIPYRQKLMGSQTDYLQPQIWMSNYDRRFYPYSYWIGQGSKVVGSLGNVLPKWKFTKNSGSPLSTITNTQYRYNPITNNNKYIYSPF